jgi:hypothetical protein
MAVYSEGLQAGTLASNLLLAEIPPDAGELTGYTPHVLLSANVSATVEIQVRNAANNANVWSHRMYLGAGEPFQIFPAAIVLLGSNERFRIMLITGLLGSVQATILT